MSNKDRPFKPTQGSWRSCGYNVLCGQDVGYQVKNYAGVSANELRDNTYLIAAAPEMLKELEDTVETVSIIRDLDDARLDHDDIQALLDVILCDFIEVIDKAKGDHYPKKGAPVEV